MRLALALLALAVCRPLAAETFAALARATLSTGPCAGASVAAQFLPLPDGAPAFALDAERALVPASNAKLAVSAAALRALGPDFRFRTVLLARERELEKGKLSVLVWRGDGDPAISGRGRPDPLEIFELWASSLAARGVRKVKRLALDESAFSGPAVAPSWPREEMSYWYQAESSAISFEDNCAALRFRPGRAAGSRPGIELLPDVGYLKIKNRAVTGPPGSAFTLDYRRKPGTNKVTFFGSIARDSPPRSDFVSVHDPARYAAQAFRAACRRHGIAVGKSIPWRRGGLWDDALVPVLEWESPPLAELLKVVDTNSQNLYAEQILRALGRRARGEGSAAAGLAAVEDFLRREGLAGAFHLVDGSGLSLENRASAAGLARLLRLLAGDPVYRDSLAVPGVDRSMRDRMRGEPLAEHMRLKGGTVSSARNLSGYLRSRRGTDYAFSILVNGPELDRPAVDAALDDVCKAAIRLLP